MQDDGNATRRSVVPRWRSLRETPSFELKSSSTDQRHRESSPLIRKLLARWHSTMSVVTAVDVLEAATVSGDNISGRSAAESLAEPTANVTAAINWSARRYLDRLPREVVPKPQIVGRAVDADTQTRVQQLKKAVIDSPRDAVSAIELSRVYTLVGQRSPAARMMERATKLEPDSRYILRCAARFYTHIGEPDRALELLWKSDSIRSDPWVQAAEVAVADLLNRAPRWGNRSIKKFLTEGRGDKSSSELAIGLASLELSSGASRRTIRKLVDRSLNSPTENALAQALWVGNRAEIDIDALPHLSKLSFANEAKAATAAENGQFHDAIKYADAWGEDQPFSVRSYQVGTAISSVYLNDYVGALAFCKRGLLTHPGHPMLANGMVLALSYLGDEKRARQYLHILNGARQDPDITPYAHAAHGLIEFSFGTVELGRESYMAAIKSASASGNLNVALSAFMFWIEQEVRRGVATREDIAAAGVFIDGKARKLPTYLARETRRAWHARETFILANMSQFTFDNYVGGNWKVSGPTSVVGSLL